MNRNANATLRPCDHWLDFPLLCGTLWHQTAQIDFSASLNDNTSIETSVGYLSFDGNVPRVDISTSSSMLSPVYDRPSPSLMFASARLPLGSLSGSKARPVFSAPVITASPAHVTPLTLLTKHNSDVASSIPLVGVADVASATLQSRFGKRQSILTPLRHTFVHFSTQQPGKECASSNACVFLCY